jgi:hypothetical protein
MTWLLVLVAWTLCAVVVAPVVGRAVAYADRLPRRRPLVPRQRSLVLR